MKNMNPHGDLKFWQQDGRLHQALRRIARPLKAARRRARASRLAFNPRCSVFIAWLIMLVMVWQSVGVPIADAAGRTPSGSRGKAAPSSRVKANLAAQGTETLTIYGPRRFDRVAGPPASVVEQFSLPPDAVSPFTILVQNGAPDGSGRVSSATIKLNGANVFTQHDFSQNVALLTKQVSLAASNTLDVRLASAPGSFLTITFTTSRASLQSITPARGVQGQTVTVTLRGHNTQWVAGQTRALFGAELSVGGAASGTPGPVTVVDSTTATAQVAIQPTASLAPRTVRVSTTIPGDNREEIEVLTDGFTVAATTPPGSSSTNVTTLAGAAGSAGFADGPAAQARFSSLAGIAVGSDDSIYVADTGNNRIRVVRSQQDQAGNTVLTASTLAGDGTAGFADGPAPSARFNNPHGVAVDSSGVVYVADTDNNRIRRIAVDGTVTTLAGNSTAGFQNGQGAQAGFNAPRGIAVDNQGNIYVADTGNSAVRSITPSGSVTTVAGDGTIGSTDSPNARFDGLTGIAVDGATLFIYLADTGNHRIRRLTPAGTVITIAGADRGFADGTADQARFAEPAGIAIDAAGKIVVADSTNSLIRFVDPNLAASGSPQAVTTLAGTGERGLTDGTGNAARFFVPRGIAVSLSSAIIVADTGNHVLRKIALPPSITSITPTQGRAGNTVTITGERFDGRSPNRNTVRFARSGGGLVTAQVTSATRTQLTVTVPQDAATGTISVETEGGTATSATSFQIIATAPIIADFNPKSGEIGSLVTLTGTALKAETGPTVVTFAGSNNTRIPALVTLVTPTEVRALVPNGAVTGTIDLTNALGRAVTTTAFTVEPGQNDYQITLAPTSTSAVQRGTATYVVFLTSPLATFSQLISLTATGLPAGASAQFDPAQITAGASSTLSVNLANADLSPATYSFTVRASGLVNGSELVRTASATLNVIAAGQTTLTGRVLSIEQEPIMGATVSLDGKTATTDAAGAFLLSGVTAGEARPLMVDGRTASAPNRTYPVIIEPATIVAGQANVVPYTFYLPPVDTQYEVDVVPGQNTVAINPRVTGLQMTIPPGANLRNRDGSPVARVSITPLPIDRTPAPLPPDVGTNIVYTSQPGGALTDIAIPVVYPNLAGADPGTRIELYAFNHDTVQWYVYGFGRVSADGRTIAPEIDPATGRSYGLHDFSWHFPNASPDGNPSDDDCGNQTGNTVDLSTGVKIEKTTDISFGGARGGLELTRIHTSDLPSFCDSCPFGRGTTHNYNIRLTGSFQLGGAGRVVFPEQASGRLFNYLRTDPDGALIFSTTATKAQLGDVVRKLTNGTFEYRNADGSLLRFDSNGRLTSIADRNNNTTTLTYTGSNLTRITDAVGRSINLQYDSSSRITRATDPLGRAWQYTYEGTPGVAGNPGLTTVTDPLNKVTRYGYVTGGRLASITDKRGIVMKAITYDASGRVIEQRFAAGGFEQYAYSLSGNVVTAASLTDSLGRSISKRFNASGYVTGMTDSLGQKSRIERDINTNLPVSTVGPCGCAEATRQFDDRGNPVATTDRLGHTTRFEYNSVFNNVTRITDKLGRVTTLGYDSRGNLTSITDALNQTTTMVYNSFGELISTTDPLGHTTTLEYDALGNMSALTDALGNRATIEYDQVGRVTAIVDPLGRRASRTLDDLDRVLSSTDPTGATSSFTYDASGNLITTTDALQRQTRATYDAKNRLVSMTDAIGRVNRIEYNTENQITALISASGRTVRYSFDKRGLIATITDPLNGVARMAYDNRGNLTSVTDKRGFVTTYAYDELYRQILRRDPLGRSSSASYDEVGNMIESVDRLGRHSTMTYDALNRMTRAVYADAVVTYAYDAASRPTRVDDTQSGFIQWAYDDAGRLLSETTPAGAVSYAYNKVGQLTSMTAATRPPVNYGYDSAGRLQSITQGAEAFTYSYDTLSRLSGMQRPNGVNTSYSYDAVNRMIQMTHAKAGAQAIEDYRYSYNAADEIISIASLASATVLPTAKTASPADSINRIAQFGSASYVYDNLGQTTSKSDASGNTSFEWDARGRLARATLPNGQVVSYGYDAAGRLSSRSAAGSSTSFLYDGADIVLDSASDGTTTNYLNGPGVDNKLRQSGAANGPLYFLHDHLGSTSALTDATGNLAQRTSYTAFGESSNSALTRYGFTGRELDSATGMMYYRARWYDPEQGRFITQDPIGFAGGLNTYAYAINNPLSFFDPSGMSWSTFGQGLVDGGITGFWAGLAWGIVFGALTSMTAGTGLAALVAAIQIIIGAEAALALAQELAELLTGDMCPDERHYRWGRLIGGFVGALAGGGLGFRIGGAAAEAAGAGGSRPGAPETPQTSACFVAGTLVQTPTGEKPIEQLRVGDEVLSADPEGGETRKQTVTRTFERAASVVLDIQAGNTTITATPEHPFWVEGKGWQRAGDLQAGSRLVTKDAKIVLVEAIRRREGSFKVYNIEVENLHTYFVSRLGILVHNECDPRVKSNPSKGRHDTSHEGPTGYDNALAGARERAGNLGNNTQKMYDPKTGTLIGEQSFDGKQGWRIDGDHVNWWNWSDGKKGTGGTYGHEFFPPSQSGPHSQYPGYAPWQ